MTVMTKPDEQKLTEETGLLKRADTEEMINKSLAEEIPNPETNDVVAYTPEPKEHPQKVVDPSNANLLSPSLFRLLNMLKNIQTT